MNIFDLVTQNELDDLPEDHNVAFLTFVRHAQRRLNEKVSSVDQSEQYGWEEANDARLGFMNVVVAAAKRFEISPFADMEVPAVVNASDATHKQFKFDLDHYMTQLAIDNTLRQRSDSVRLSEKARDRIRQHVSALRECVENSSLSDSKKSALFRYLDEFEKELIRARVSLLKVTWIGIQILGIPGSIWASNEVVTKLIANINQTVAEEKLAEDERPKLPVTEPPKALMAPRRVDAPAPSQGFGAPLEDDLDDDVPF